MKHSWLRGAPFLLLGLADMALSGYLLWGGSRAMFRMDGPAEVALGGFACLLGLGTAAAGLPMFWASWYARRPLPLSVLASLYLVGALPWLGVAAERFWLTERIAPDRVQIVCVTPEGTHLSREVGKVVLREHSSGSLFFDSIFYPQIAAGNGFIYVIEPPRGRRREFPMDCSPSGLRCTPLEASEADLRQALGLLPRCES